MLIGVKDHAAFPSSGWNTWWSLTGDVAIDPIVKAWRKAGLSTDFEPDYTPPGTCLWRAVATVASDKKILHRKMPNERNSWAIVREAIEGKHEDASFDYRPEFQVWLEGDELNFHYRSQDPTGLAWAQEMAGFIEEKYEYYYDHYDVRAMSNWLVDIMTNYVHAVALRPRGGFYYVPPARADLFFEILAVIEQTAPDHKLYKMPVVESSADVAEAVLDALNAEATKVLTDIEEDIDKGIKKRAIRSRKERAEELYEKLGDYQGVLGDGLKNVLDQIIAVKASLTEMEIVYEYDGLED